MTYNVIAYSGNNETRNECLPKGHGERKWSGWWAFNEVPGDSEEISDINRDTQSNEKSEFHIQKRHFDEVCMIEELVRSQVGIKD